MILVTGATGFIGEQLVRSLLQRGEPVRILVRSNEKATAVFGPLTEQMELTVGDLGDVESLQRAVDGVSQVYHLASWISFQGSLPKMRAVNVEGIRHLMEACRQVGVKRVVHMSSVAAGGPAVVEPDGQIRPRTENDPPVPLPDPYGQTKLEQEQVVLTYPAKGVEVVIVRPSAVFGPGNPGGINTLIWMIRQRRLPFYLGSAQFVTNLVFVRDVVNGTVAAMEKGHSGEVYNLVGANLTQEQLMGLIAQVSGGRAPGWSMPVRVLLGAAKLVALASKLAMRRRALVHPNDVRSWTAPWMISDAKAQAELGLVPSDLAPALRETLAWLTERKETRSAVASSHVD